MLITENKKEQNVLDENALEQNEVKIIDKKSEQKSAKEQASEKDCIINELSELACLLSTSVKSLKEEFYLIQISKLMSKIQKVIVRYDMTEKQLESLFFGANYYGLGGIAVAPAYLTNSIRQNKKLFGKLKLTSLIDFPFGESSLKGKVANIKESIKIGADSVAVCVPSLMLNKDNSKLFKKECRKYCWSSKKKAGIVLNASDVNEQNFLEAIKTLKKVKISYIVLAFGDATIEEVKAKLSMLTKSPLGKGKTLSVFANVEKIETACELFKLGADSILTPFADEIGLDLVKRFNLIIK